MMIKVHISFVFVVCLLTIGSNYGQREDKVKFNEGVNAYRNGNYEVAQQEFEAAYQSNAANKRALFNAGNAAYLKGNFEQANQYFSDYAKQADSNTEMAKAQYNQGNAYLKIAEQSEQDPEQASKAQEFYKKAIDSFKGSLKNNPNDADAKYNLTYALSKLQQQQNQQNQDQQKNQDQQDQQQKQDQQENQDQNQNNQDQSSDQNQSEQDKSDQEKKNNQNQDKGNQNEDQKEDQGQQNSGKQGDQQNEEPVQGQISKAQAEKDLDAINADEGKILQKVLKKRGQEKTETKSGKDW